MRIVKLCLVALAAGSVVVSCAKREDDNTDRLEQLALDAWIEKYVKSPVTGRGVDVVRQSNGMWVEFMEDGDQRVESSRDTAVWLQLKYTSTDVNGNVFATRDSIEALRQRTFTPHTYYVPEYIYCGSEWLGMPEGQYFALRNDLIKPDGSKIKLSVGSRVKLYLTPHLAFGSGRFTNDQGYGGQYPLDSDEIVIHDVTINEVVKNPLTYEEGLVERYATGQWGLGINDTIAPCFYVDSVNFRPSAELLDKFPNKPFVKEYVLTADSTANIWFVGKFLPTSEYPGNFIHDTNISSVYEKFYYRRNNENYLPEDKTLSVFSYTPKNDQSDYIAAWYRAIPKLRRGQWYRMVFPSAYGYGAVGLSKRIKDEQDLYNTMLNYYFSYNSGYGSYGSNYGGYGYGYGDYGYGYGSYGYNTASDYYGYSTSGYSTEEDQQQIMTEIQAYTPLMFEFYIAPDEEE